MRADMLLIAGVGLLGVYAIYRMTKASDVANPLSPPDRGQTPTPLVVPTGALPELPGALPAPPADVAIVNGDPLKLQGGAWYQGRIETNPASGTLSESSTKDQIAAFLTSLGFGNASPASPVAASQIFATPLEASQAIFQPFAFANPGNGTRWFYVRMPAFDANTGVPINATIARPKGLVAIWKAAPPANLIATSGQLPGRIAYAPHVGFAPHSFRYGYGRPIGRYHR